MTPDGKLEVNPETFFCNSTGKARAERYFERFAKNGDRKDVLRSENESTDGISLAAIQPLLSTLQERAHNEVERYTSTNFGYLKGHNLITIPELKADLIFLNGQLSDEEKVKPEKNQSKSVDKPDWITAVISARQKLIAADSSWVATRKSQLVPEIEGGAQDTRSLHARRGDALDDVHISFCGTASREKFGRKKYKFQGSADIGSDDDTEEGGSDDEDEDDEFDMPPESQSSTMTGATGVTDASSPSTGPHSGLGLLTWRNTIRNSR